MMLSAVLLGLTAIAVIVWITVLKIGLSSGKKPKKTPPTSWNWKVWTWQCWKPKPPGGSGGTTTPPSHGLRTFLKTVLGLALVAGLIVGAVTYWPYIRAEVNPFFLGIAITAIILAILYKWSPGVAVITFVGLLVSALFWVTNERSNARNTQIQGNSGVAQYTPLPEKNLYPEAERGWTVIPALKGVRYHVEYTGARGCWFYPTTDPNAPGPNVNNPELVAQLKAAGRLFYEKQGENIKLPTTPYMLVRADSDKLEVLRVSVR